MSDENSQCNQHQDIESIDQAPKKPSKHPEAHPQKEPVVQTHSHPLHGVTLKTILEELVYFYGWPSLSRKIEIRCFYNDPSVKSSLKFLRKTPWARAKVEALYCFMVTKKQRNESTDLSEFFDDLPSSDQE